ncbi:MAG TPA: hypothetical protein VMU81_31470 [Acetobacteraceae bacterium]|nr:hypothetical protein [Acetobacteraceae bacterium]
MPQDQAGQGSAGQAGEGVFDDLRGLIRDVRAWLEAMPFAVEASGALPLDVMTLPTAEQPPSARDAGRSDVIGDATTTAAVRTADEGAEPSLVTAAVDCHAAALSEMVAHAVDAVQMRADQFDVVLADIRRARAETAAA